VAERLAAGKVGCNKIFSDVKHERKAVVLTHYNLYLLRSFTLQHVFSPYFLISNGIDLRKHTPVKNAFHLLLVSLTGRTMLWLGLNGIAYKTKLHVFLIWQALMVVLTLPMELGTCEWALSTHPRLAEKLFGTLHAWGGLLAGAGMPPVDNSEHVSALAGIKHDCYHVQTYLAIMFGYVMPAVVIWLYETSVWKEFLVSEPTDLTWPGGPTSREIGQALAMLQEKETRKQQEIPTHKLQRVSLVVLGTTLSVSSAYCLN
jgi:hypothetical protein